MAARQRLFGTGQSLQRPVSWRDGLVLLCVAALLYLGMRLALLSPAEIEGPAISLAPGALPLYAGLSVGRMASAYALSLLFTLAYGYAAARHRRAERILMPLLDVLQSVPILSFLPVVLLSLSAIVPQGTAAELASVVLIFTSQAWNLAFAWYQSLTTIPKELREASAIYRFGAWMRFRTLELPFGAIGLIWNSMMSWAGGWFFLMAAETFNLGQRDFRLPGLGSFLQEAARQGDMRAIAWGLGALILVVVVLDQVVWRPLLAWSERFKLQMVADDNPPTSWFYEVLRASRLAAGFASHVVRPLSEGLDTVLGRRFLARGERRPHANRRPWLLYLAGAALMLGALLGAWRAGATLLKLAPDAWGTIGLSVLATLLRVGVALALALLWTIPVGVAIGTNARLAALLQPLVQITASVPATALFPVFLVVLLRLPGGLNLAAALLMLLGTQWYLLFNIIAGAAAIPQDLKFTSTLLHLTRWERWRTLTLPALFPYIVTGAITASGGAWNASIVAEHVEFGGASHYALGIGALIARATATGDYALLLGATLSMVVTVVLTNRLVWRQLYRLAEEQYRME